MIRRNCVRAVGLNHIDVWGFRGMAFAKRVFPLAVGAEASCDVVAVGDGVSNVAAGKGFDALNAVDVRRCAQRAERRAPQIADAESAGNYGLSGLVRGCA